MAAQNNNQQQNIVTYKVICSVLGGLLALLLTILGFLFSNWMTNQQKTNEKILKNTNTMGTQLIQVRLKITQLQSKMLTTDTVRMITRQQINNYHRQMNNYYRQKNSSKQSQ